MLTEKLEATPTIIPSGWNERPTWTQLPGQDRETDTKRRRRSMSVLGTAHSPCAGGDEPASTGLCVGTKLRVNILIQLDRDRDEQMETQP